MGCAMWKCPRAYANSLIKACDSDKYQMHMFLEEIGIKQAFCYMPFCYI